MEVLIDVDNTEKYRCLSLCSGYGGIELGLRRIFGKRMRTVAYVEVEAFAVANLVSKMEAGLLDAAPVWTDIKTFNARPFRDRIHIITAGYPCQGESVSGKREGNKDPRFLWPHIERIIKTVRPVWFFGENVAGHLTLSFPEVYRSLRNLDYKVEAGLFSAAECGAPHKRGRLFILAHNTSCGCETSKSKQKRKFTSGGIGSKLADAENSDGWAGGQTKQGKVGFGRRGPCGEHKTMADTATQRFQRDEPEGITFAERQIEQCRWPARPGQPQYEWEEPRTIVGLSRSDILWRQSKNIRKTTGKSFTKIRQSRQIRNNIRDPSEQGQTQSKLGRATDGTSCRLDRLRLLGNGVVPQQAEKAFRELIRLFE